MLQLSSDLARSLGLDNAISDKNNEIELCAGVKKTKIRVAVSEASTNSFLLNPETVEEALLARTNQPLSFYFNKESHQLLAGPFLGIACGIPVIMHQPEVLSLYQEIAHTACNHGAVCYFFTPDLVDFAKETITAFTYRLTKSCYQDWVLQDFPVANVIYNQTGYISEELRPCYRRFFNNYLPEKMTVRLINPDVNRKVWMIEVNPKPNWNLPPGTDTKKMEKKWPSICWRTAATCSTSQNTAPQPGSPVGELIFPLPDIILQPLYPFDPRLWPFFFPSELK